MARPTLQLLVALAAAQEVTAFVRGQFAQTNLARSSSKTCATTTDMPPSEVKLPDTWETDRSHNVNSMADYDAMYAESISDPGAFWTKIASQFDWKGAPLDAKTALDFNFDRSKGDIYTKWFAGSQTNLAHNALDKQIADGRGDQVAIYAERNEKDEKAEFQPESYTYSQLNEEVNKLANALKSVGVVKGDRVTIFMAHIPENCIAMLACARIGAVHSVVFGGFSKEALSGRILDCGAKVVITQDGVMRGKKIVPLKGIMDDAVPLVEEGGGSIDAAIVLKRLGNDACLDTMTMKKDRDVWWEDLVDKQSTEIETEWLDAEDPSFILYTSGSTGSPKGILHTTGGYMLGAATSFKYTFDTQTDDHNDVFFCTADCGWITGHSYVAYGPLLNGATQVVFEGVPSYPGIDRLWRIVDKHQVSHLYTAPTAVRSLMGAGEGPVKAHSRKSLKLLGSVGEPINPEAWRWYHEVVGDSRCPIVDTWWQTETGAIMIAPLPAKGWDQPPGSATYPFFGVQPVLLDQQGVEIEATVAEGLLAIKEPWPSAIRGVWGDQQRMEETYFPFEGYYLTGDGARRDEKGRYTITGRVDDVIIVSGHNIGTAEVESALVAHPDVAEAAVVGVPHDVKGSALYCYVTLNRDVAPSEELRGALRLAVRAELGAFAAPDTIHWAPGLPKTRSGKIMRRVLRKIAEIGPEIGSDDLGDTSTLAEPAVVDQLIEGYGK